MSEARLNFSRWTEQLLDSATTYGRQREIVNEWCAWAFATLGVNEDDSSAFGDRFRSDTLLSVGKALSPLGAARCVREHRRTSVFLQAMDAAIRAARARFPGETIHVLEAGCGPLAPLSLPFAFRYPPDEVCFTLLDLHPASIDSVRRLVGELGVDASVRAYLTADATTVAFAEAERPHVIACEVLLRALKREPQVAVTMNLAPQLRPGGFFLPERIDVQVGFLDSGSRMRALRGEEPRGNPIAVLGCAFVLDAHSVDALEIGRDARIFGGKIDVPPHDPVRAPLKFFTRIQVWREHALGDFDSSLNLPERVHYPVELAQAGGIAEFSYEISEDPGIRLNRFFPPSGKYHGSVNRVPRPLPARIGNPA